MRDTARRSQSQRTPGRSAIERVTIVVLVIVGLGLLMIGRTEPEVFDGMKQSVMETLSPVLDTASGPISNVRNWRRSADDMMSVYDDNQRLRKEIEELRIEAERARRLQSLIDRYQALLNVKVDPRIDYVTARIIGDSGGPFARSLIINAGADDGIQTGQGVIDANGLIGHVVSAGPHAARVLLLTDVESHIPVLVEPAGVRAMLTGDGKDQAMLEHLPPGYTVKVGSRIVTSSVGGVLPPGLLIGEVASVVPNSAVAQVKLASSFDRVDVVRILRYDLPLDSGSPDTTLEPSQGLSAPGRDTPAPVAQSAPPAPSPTMSATATTPKIAIPAPRTVTPPAAAAPLAAMPPPSAQAADAAPNPAARSSASASIDKTPPTSATGTNATATNATAGSVSEAAPVAPVQVVKPRPAAPSVAPPASEPPPADVGFPGPSPDSSAAAEAPRGGTPSRSGL